MSRKKHFLLYEVCFLSLMATLVFVMKTFLRTPMKLPGHNAILWVIPFIVAIALTKKFGSGTYVGVLAGLMIGTMGTANTGILKVFEYIAMGFTMDVLALVFKGHLGNVFVGILLGAFGSFAKALVNLTVSSAVGANANILLIGIGATGALHLIFGGAGGVIAAIIVNRVQVLHLPNGQQKPQKTRQDKKQLNLFCSNLHVGLAAENANSDPPPIDFSN
ncbi:MAG: cobalt ABC transporter permease [Candidatus Bathyarchaeota archaeon]|nr:cobalt ABC transporter permease [Candidatus Bathyarchaeota archaeon]